MAAESTFADTPGTLSGVARVLVNAGKLDAKAAETLTRTAKEQKRNFVSALMQSGTINPSDLAHTLSQALSVPLVDLSAIDLQRVPRNIIDNKLAAQYQVLPLSKRGNRLFVAGADPTDQEAIERIKFATQLAPEWVLVEHDKLSKALEGITTSAEEQLSAIASSDFEFDVTEDMGAPAADARRDSRCTDQRVRKARGDSGGIMVPARPPWPRWRCGQRVRCAARSRQGRRRASPRPHPPGRYRG